MMNLIEMYKNLTEEEKKEFVNLIFDEINKKADKSTFLEQYHNSLKAIGDKPLSVK